MYHNLPKLFSPFKLKDHIFKNRIFSTGHMTVMLSNGFPNEDFFAYHTARAKGGAGLIIIEAARIHGSGDSGRPAIRAYKDECILHYRRVANDCHLYGCKVFGQLTHPGREMTLAQDGSHVLALAPSAIPNERFHVMPKAMSLDNIKEIIEGFRAAAERLSIAGLDGVEVIASHGYLLGQFLNPRINIRDDKYGGSFLNRIRFVREVLKAVRLGAGKKMIVGLRLSGEEKDHAGLERNEVLNISAALAKDSLVDYLNVTVGTSAGLSGSTHIVPPMAYEPAYVAPLAKAIREQTSLPIFVAGRINQPQTAETLLKSEQADMCGMTRALISDPNMPLKAEMNRIDDIRTCVGCNQACIEHMLKGYPISCIQHPETGREIQYGKLRPANFLNRILVVGGGPAGMKAATVAAKRGHDVTLCESNSKLGGQVNLAQLLPGRMEFGGVTSNLEREARKAGVKIKLNCLVDRRYVENKVPNSIVLAVGAKPYSPKIEKHSKSHVVGAWQILTNQKTTGSRVVIADWRCDWIGLGLSELLVRRGCHVRLVVNGILAGQTIPQYTRDKWLGDLHRLGVIIITHSRLYGVDEQHAYFEHTLSGDPIVLNDVDTLVTASGHEAKTDLVSSLKDFNCDLHLIGDCLSPRTVEEAVLEGLKIGSSI